MQTASKDTRRRVSAAAQAEPVRINLTEAPTLVGSEPETPIRAPLTFEQLPILRRNEAGGVLHGLAIDYWAYTDNALLISGWISGSDIEQFGTGSVDYAPGVIVSLFRRPDVETAFATFTVGLLGVVTLNETGVFNLFGFQLRFPARREDDNDTDAFLTEHPQRFGFLLKNLAEGAAERALIAKRLSRAPDTYKGACAFLEQAKGIPEFGGIVIGWAVNLPGVTLALVDQAGRILSLQRAIRWHRADIVNGMSHSFGNYTFNAGLLQAWREPFRLGEEVRIIALDGEAAYVLASCSWEAAPIEPASYARWAFDLPTPLDRFSDRLEHHDGPIIEALVARDRTSWSKAAPETHKFGPDVRSPQCSIVVPLYGRFDFLLNQMLEFSEDSFIRTNVDLIYVVDDPRIASDALQQSDLLYEAYRVPFRLVVSPENRGFAGATNLGASVSQAPTLLLLNSDVIPVEPGWLKTMLDRMNGSPNIGIVGARLYFPNGSIQHDGMTFHWEPNWQAYLNKHPRAGMEPALARSNEVDDPAVTAACLMIRKSTFDSVGGLDDGFLVGDFEDSDLCLKVRHRGQEIVCCRDVNLTHLERQSFSGIGADGFRERVARYNAWRHHRRWSNYIESLMKRKSAEAAA